VSLGLVSDDPTLRAVDLVGHDKTLFCSVLFEVASALLPNLRYRERFVCASTCSCVTLSVAIGI
jgi:hypothetical protein